MYKKVVKRCIDFLISLIAIIILSPIILILAIMVRFKLGSPIIFKQDRPGRKNKIFKLYKFRTMTDEKDENGELLPDEVRLTKFGRRLRETSLDELPELFNILKGDMSIIGPRPLLPKYLDVYSVRQQRRHEVLPGLSGLAQVSGRNALTWEEKFEYDLEYVNDISFALDVKIFFRTIYKVFKKSDISSADSVTMTAFKGTKRQRFGNQHSRTVRVMFVGIGRQVELVQTFQYAAGKLGIDIVIYGVDSDLSEPGVLACKVQKQSYLPDDERYPAQILDWCIKEKIELVVPVSLAQLRLATIANEFASNGIQLVLSDINTLEMCMDKDQIIKYFNVVGVRTPLPVNRVQDFRGSFPATIEVRDKEKGVVSFIATDRDELEYHCSRYDEYLIRTFLEGEVYEIDVMCDYKGNPLYITPKRRDENRDDAVAVYTIVQDREMVKDVMKIVRKLKPVGPITIGVVKEKETGLNYFVSIRPILSNNVAVSIKAGADMPKAMLKMMFGIELEYEPEAAVTGLIFGKYEQSILIEDTRQKVNTFKDFGVLKDVEDDIEAVVFALDDTLYSEKSFFRSGFRALASYLPGIDDAFNKLCRYMDEGQEPVSCLLKNEGKDSPELLEECLDVIRTHKPNIELYPGVEELLKELHRRKKVVGLITDGDPVQQHNKIDALGIARYVDEIIITDELAGNGEVKEFRKPNDLAYLIMRRRLDIPLRNMAFVGDDPDKDFIAPSMLGMKCYLFENADRLLD